MADIFETTMVCDSCNKKTSKIRVLKDGFALRAWECKNCNKRFFHPLDKQEYEEFVKLKNKVFKVKLRLVGNSYAVSIPREIIDFEEEFHRELKELINISMDEPGKLSLFFKGRNVY